MNTYYSNLIEARTPTGDFVSTLIDTAPVPGRFLDTLARHWQSATMVFGLKIRKSAGIRVTGTVHRLIARGNRARDERQWTSAAAAYRAALGKDPRLQHIWVQLGHMLREAGDAFGAKLAYSRAWDIGPPDAEPLLYLAHMAREAGDKAAAMRMYQLLMETDPEGTKGSAELGDLLACAPEEEGRRLRGDLRSLIEPGRAEDAVALPMLAFDVSSLVDVWLDGRADGPAYRERITTLLDVAAKIADGPRFCCITADRNEWLEVPPETFLCVARLGSQGARDDKSVWGAAIARLRLAVLAAEPCAFAPGGALIGMGLGPRLGNHLLSIRYAQQRWALCYWPVIDQLALENSDRADLLACADGLLVASDAVGDELAAALGASTQGKVVRSMASGNWVEALNGQQIAQRAEPRISTADPCTWYALNDGGSLAASGHACSGDRFRAGMGWHMPDTWGCWTRSEGGELALRLSETMIAPRLYLQLRGLPEMDSHYAIKIENLPRIHGFCRAGENKWIMCDLASSPQNGVLRVHIAGEHRGDVPVTIAADRRLRSASIGLIGFCVIERRDLTARRSILEAVALGDAPFSTALHNGDGQGAVSIV